MRSLLTIGNPKTQKSLGFGYFTAVLHLAPADLSGRDVCPWRTPGCTAVCLGHGAGRAAIRKASQGTITSTSGVTAADNAIMRARIERTRRFFDDRPGFIADLMVEIFRLQRKARKLGLRLAVRLNGTSDLSWERIAPQIFAEFPDVQFYDYTKSDSRMRSFLRGKLPANYHLTFSLAENNSAQACEILRLGGNVAAVVAEHEHGLGGTLGDLYEASGFSMHDADKHDLRFLDPRGSLGILTPKGIAKRDTSGFVLR